MVTVRTYGKNHAVSVALSRITSERTVRRMSKNDGLHIQDVSCRLYEKCETLRPCCDDATRRGGKPRDSATLVATAVSEVRLDIDLTQFRTLPDFGRVALVRIKS